ncbi:Hydroxysteroid 11-beta-dehydrogenase-like protein [Melia azedarach]|uniref:Hydroxysteroid 11-beta-dehydrogenase-like protein n=1 Tax=Melia azedarach TaxID=155640 RepID=A0ACC1Z1W1_MELAZ|nr:Hydroxysteroid 11-beta-dehydrogenase-like protein [Melia azedarach]
MDLIHGLMNIFLPPLTFIALLLVLPPYLLLKFLAYIRRQLLSTENMAGKVVVVTGAASGIGEQIAYEYAKRGASLALVDVRGDRLGPVVERSRRLGSPDVISLQADVSVVDDCNRFVNATVNHFGRLDHLNMDCISDFTPIMDVNFWGTVYGTHFAVPHLRKSKGQIIVVASTCGWYPLPRLTIYNASKAALISFCETLRTEIGSDIGITIVTPGLIKSEMRLSGSLPKGMAFISMESKEECAKAIVRSACRGDNYLVEPSWVRVLFLWKVLCPELVEYCNRWVFVIRPRKVRRNITPGKQT